jgi:hypothetical protein
MKFLFFVCMLFCIGFVPFAIPVILIALFFVLIWHFWCWMWK